MASQNLPLQSADTPNNSVIIRMKRKRHAAPLESFFIESETAEKTLIKPKLNNSGAQSKAVFIRTTSIDLTTPTENCIDKVLGHSLTNNDIGGQMKKLKLGDMTETPIDNSNKTSNSVQVFDIVQDSVTEEYTLFPCAQTQPDESPKPVIICNGDEMIREILPNPPSTADNTYVYDLYLTEEADLSMFDDPTSILINPLEYDITWVDPITKVPHQHYLDEYDDDELTDDSNGENHSRNDYPEQPDSDPEYGYSSRYDPDRDLYPDYFQCNQKANCNESNDPWASDLSAHYLKREKDLYDDDDEVLKSDDY